MEFPHLGQNCSFSSCKQLDFLPFKCDSCSKVFCKDHYNYLNHSCELSYKKDYQIPLCPLCNQPVPYKRNELPDTVMSAHIDRDCKSDPAEERRRKIFNHKCNMKNCKQKELMPLICKKCNKNYCLKHRHENDHNCNEQQQQKHSIAANRLNQNAATGVNAARLAFYEKNLKNIQNPSMSDNDALQMAIKMSLNEQNSNSNVNKQILEDEEYAKSLAQADVEQQSNNNNNNRRNNNNSSNDNKDSSCLVC